MKILVDKNIPFLDQLSSEELLVEAISGEAFSGYALKGVDGLIVRTRTRCDETLLEGSCVRHIATATIGFDHIDLAYCQSHGIEVSISAGCNAQGVLQYVMAALIELERLLGEDIRSKRLGIVGLGNVGSAVKEIATGVGFDVICCDPFVDDPSYVSFQELIASADIITSHTPLTTNGSYPTFHLYDKKAFDTMKEGLIFINSSRGEVVDEQALIDAISSGRVSYSVLDVWSGEPSLNSRLLSLATIATPHIAGYSLQGKAMASAMAVRATASYFGLEGYEQWYPSDVALPPYIEDLSWQKIRENMPLHYNIMEDSLRLKEDMASFESQRNGYRYRNEFFRAR